MSSGLKIPHKSFVGEMSKNTAYLSDGYRLEKEPSKYHPELGVLLGAATDGSVKGFDGAKVGIIHDGYWEVGIQQDVKLGYLVMPSLRYSGRSHEVSLLLGPAFNGTLFKQQHVAINAKVALGVELGWKHLVKADDALQDKFKAAFEVVAMLPITVDDTFSIAPTGMAGTGSAAFGLTLSVPLERKR